MKALEGVKVLDLTMHITDHSVRPCWRTMVQMSLNSSRFRETSAEAGDRSTKKAARADFMRS